MGGSSSSFQNSINKQEMYVNKNAEKYTNSGYTQRQIKGKLRNEYNNVISDSYIPAKSWNRIRRR